MHDEMPFGLARQTKYAALSSEDLNTMGKRAADSYLSCGVPLNKAVVKLAQQHPSSSPHQVMRVVEYANQETFQRLFDDNEKYACDKNIEFPLADPRVILHDLNDGARPHVMTPPPDDYSQAPVKMAHADVEADLELCRMFGVEPVSPGIEKEAMRPGVGRTLLNPLIGGPVLGGLAGGVVGGKTSGEGERAKGVAQGALSGAALGTLVGAASIPLSVGLAYALQSERGLHLSNVAQLAGGALGGSLIGQRLAGKKKESSAVDRILETVVEKEAGVGWGGAASAGPDQRLKGALTGGLLGGAGGALAGTGAQGLKSLWSKGTTPVPFAAMKPGWRSAAGAGAGGVLGGLAMQKSSAAMTKEAMDYAKVGRSKAALVLDDMRAATAIDRIKQATADRGLYPEANPYGELIRAKQQLTKMAQDARDAAAKNESLYHEALSKLAFEVKQHLLRGGNLGSVAHAMGTVTPPDAVKIAMRAILPDLQKHGLDPVRTQADMVHYEMVKGASSRVLNPKHPITQSYAGMVKLAEGQATLEETFYKLHQALKEVEGTLKEAMVKHAATR